MSAKSGTGFPEWVEKYREPGRTVKKTKSGYALYKCISKYVAGKSPKSVQTYLGVIKEDEGFIPKKESAVTRFKLNYLHLFPLCLFSQRKRVCGIQLRAADICYCQHVMYS